MNLDPRADMRRAVIVGLVAAASLFGLAACGDGEDRPGEVSEVEDGGDSESVSESGTGSVTEAEAAALAFTEAEADVVVGVELGEYYVLPAQTEIPAGKVFFKAENVGEMVHELVVTPVGATDEEGAFGEVDDIAPGEVGELAIELEPGTYQLACFIVEEVDGEVVNHYALGMHFDITVT